MSSARIDGPTPLRVCSSDREILRRLAERIRAISEDPLNCERRELWHLHDRGESPRPLVLTETDAGLHLVVPDFRLECEEEWARQQERQMREAIIHFEILKDDRVVEPRATINWDVKASGYGVDIQFQWGDGKGRTTGSYHWEHPIKDIEKDFDRLRPREFSVDRGATLELKQVLEDVYKGVLPVEIRGGFWWSMGMTETAAHLVGLENFLVYMLDEPETLHRFMAFLRDDRLAFIDWLEHEELFSLNNENDYVGSGSIGYTRELPASGPGKESRVRARDLWVLSESQETVGVGPGLFDEFVFPYQSAVIERFGRCYYGCCEPIHDRWHVIRQLRNLKRVSISPWCDQEKMAPELAADYSFSRKPNPTLLSMPAFIEEAIRDDLGQTLEITRNAGCRRVELIMKDVHTLNNEPRRLVRWVEVAREEIRRLYNGH